MYVIYAWIIEAVKRNRRIVVTVIHLTLAALSSYLAFAVRFEGSVPAMQFLNFLTYLPVLLVVRFLFYYQIGLYRDLWRYSGASSLVKIAISATLGSAAFYVLVRHVFGNFGYPRSVYVIDWLLLIIFYGGARVSIRALREHLGAETTGRRMLIVGAGDAGEMILSDMHHNPKYDYRPVAFLDDDPYKKGLSIHGVPIFGPIASLERAIAEYAPEEILIAIPSAGSGKVRRIYEACKPFKLPIKTLPVLKDILHGKLSASQIKPLSMEDLLQREPVTYDIATVREFVRGRTVLVSGAGGSIGSELCRQIVRYRPARLIMLDRYENGLFHVDHEIRSMGLGETAVAAVGDILDSRVLNRVFSSHRPNVVFHAAAHKHVPLMEHNPLEAVKNNVFGTRSIIEASVLHGVKNFVMISTDKAVNPTNVMGATKRIAEFLALDAGRHSDTTCTTVRFGNVLGSNGSVLHVFKDQIARGGPVTVTHPDMRRFFMLIPEAVQLVLVAAASGSGGEIFVLEMGEPVRIADFAENLIRLSGLVPHEDVEIAFTGLRPGEKLFEELFDAHEHIAPTQHDKLMMAVPSAPPREDLADSIRELERLVAEGRESDVAAAIARIVPGYTLPRQTL